MNIIEFNKIPVILELSDYKGFLMKNRIVSDIFNELNIDKSKPIREQIPDPIPSRKDTDQIFFEALGLSSAEITELYWSLCEMIKNRLKKAKSL